MKIQKEKIIDGVVFIYIAVFTYAALSKLSDYKTFSLQLQRSSLLTDYAGILSWAVPSLELMISTLLIFRLTRLIALYASFMLMAMFSVYIYAITRFTDNAPCSCGGILEKMTWNQHLVFNIGLLVLCGYAVFVFPITNRAKPLET